MRQQRQHYIIVVTKGKKHFFTTADNSIFSHGKLNRLYPIMLEKFPESEDYHLMVVKYPEGTPVKMTKVDNEWVAVQ